MILCYTFILLTFLSPVLGNVTNQESVATTSMQKMRESDPGNQTYGINEKCNLVINEINVESPLKPERNEFFELKLFCAEGISLAQSLQGFKLITIQPSDMMTPHVPPTIELVVNFWNAKVTQTGLFTVGGLGISDADMSVKSSMVQYRRKLTSDMSLFSFIKNANRLPLGVALLYNSQGLPEIKLDKKSPFLRLTDPLKETVKKFLVDLVVYGRRAVGEHCDIFDYLHEDYFIPSKKPYVLREYDINLGKDFSLNRCTISKEGFHPESFKLGTPTPGKENDCTGAEFIFGKKLRDFSEPLLTVPPEDATQTSSSFHPQRSCSSAYDPSLYWSLESALVNKEVQTEISMAKSEVCTDYYGIDMQTGKHEEAVNKASLKKHMMDENTKIPEWETTSFFQDRWLNLIKMFQKNVIPVALIEKDKTKVWFEYLPNNDDPHVSQYRCRLCHKYYDVFQLDHRYKTVLAQKHGILRKSYKLNWETIDEHPKSKSHLKVIETLIKKEEKSLKRQFDEIQRKEEDRDEGIMKVTARMVRTVFVETKLAVALNSHSALVNLQESNGINLGYHHYERRSATRIMKFISDEMNKILINHLLQKNSPLSLIIDSSTDVRQFHYLIVYFQALEEERPTVYFYRLIPIGVDEKAKDIVELLLTAWKSEDLSILNYMRKNLAGFASDGAAVMMGRYNGVVKQLENFVERPLYAVHCMAHRLHLGIRHAMHKVSYYSSFEKTINSLFKFYNSHGHKRKAHLQELAEELQLKMFELNTIFEIRWIASEYMALERIMKSWFLLVTDLNEISVDQHFTSETQQIAKGLKNQLSDRHFVITLHFTLDMLNELKQWSRILQVKAGLLIGKEKLRQDMINTFTEMKTQDGAFLKLFLNEVECSDSPNTVCNIAAYENSSSVIFKTVSLPKTNRMAPDFVSLRKNILEHITIILESYFPSGKLQPFEIFVPSNIPNDPAKIRFYGLQEIITLSKQFNWNESLMVEEWKEFIEAIFNHEHWCLYRKTDAKTFWPYFLKENNIKRGTAITLLIRTVLVLPIGSADAERGFSLMKKIRSDRRSNLHLEALDALMRINLNGPNDLERFPAVKYAKLWVKAGHMKTDDPARIKRKKVDFLDDNELEDSFLESNLF